MKFATYNAEGGQRLGLVDVEQGRILDLAAAASGVGWSPAPFASMLALIEADDMGLELAGELAAGAGPWAPLASVRLLAPLPEPRQMRDAMSFETHIRQSGRGGRAMDARAKGGEAAFREALAAPLEPLAEIYRQMPIYYLTNRLIVVGPEATVRWPRYSQVWDYELEIAIVTRRTRANIPEAEAAAHIFGYTIFNDFSARDRQAVEMQGRLGPAKGKSFDGSNVLGPWIVTADEIGDPHTLGIRSFVNGELRQNSNTSNLIFNVFDQIALLSQAVTLEPGDVIFTGTPGGVGMAMKPPRYLKAGDVVRVEIDRIGAIEGRMEPE